MLGNRSNVTPPEQCQFSLRVTLGMLPSIQGNIYKCTSASCDKYSKKIVAKVFCFHFCLLILTQCDSNKRLPTIPNSTRSMNALCRTQDAGKYRYSLLSSGNGGWVILWKGRVMLHNEHIILYMEDTKYHPVPCQN